MSSVVIIGAGPTGMTVAALLAKRGVHVVLVEREPEIRSIPRAVHFDDEVMRIFDAAGLASSVAAVSVPIEGMRLVDRDRRVLAEFTRTGSGEHGFARSNAFDQPELEAAMRAAIAARGIDVRAGVEAEAVEPLGEGDAPLRVTLRDVQTNTLTELEVDAVLGCDGARSRTRAFVGGEVEDLGFDARWLVVDVETASSLDLYPGCIQVADPRGPATYFCGGERRHRWEFMVGADESTASLTREASLRARIAVWIGARAAAAASLRRSAVYSFHSLVARRWRRGMVFLLGDAAHQTPPFIGQGMGAGVRDASNLAWKLAMVLEGRAAPSILDTYEAERRPHVRAVIQQAILLGRVMAFRRAEGVRDMLVRAVDRFDVAHAHLHRGAFPPLRAGTLVGLPGSRGAGSLVPRAPIELDGRPTHLDMVLGAGFSLVTRASAADAPFPGRVVRLGARMTRGVRDVDGVLSRWFEATKAECAIVRPDRVVLASGANTRVHGWSLELARRGLPARALAL